MKNLSDSVQELFMRTGEFREAIAESDWGPSLGAINVGGVNAIDKVAKSNAEAFNLGVEYGVKMMILRNFEKLQEEGKASPVDAIMYGLLTRIPLSKGAAEGKSILRKPVNGCDHEYGCSSGPKAEIIDETVSDPSGNYAAAKAKLDQFRDMVRGNPCRAGVAVLDIRVSETVEQR